MVPVTGLGDAAAGVATVGDDAAETVTAAVPLTAPLVARTVSRPVPEDGGRVQARSC